MLRRALSVLLIVILILCAPSALASFNVGGVRAYPKQSFAFRTGPGTDYGELDTPPQSPDVVAIEIEYENGVPWVLCEFQCQNRRVRAYTDLTHISLTDDVMIADHARLDRALVYDGDVYAAPDLDSEVRACLSAGTRIVFLDFEGDYCFIEYDAGGHRDRGYIREESFMPDLGEFAEPFPENPGMTLYVIKPAARLYAEPRESAATLFVMPFDASCTWEFDSPASDRAPEGWLALYYGGLLGYGRSKDLSDLRFDSPEDARHMLTMMGEYEE